MQWELDGVVEEECGVEAGGCRVLCGVDICQSERQGTIGNV